MFGKKAKAGAIDARLEHIKSQKPRALAADEIRAALKQRTERAVSRRPIYKVGCVVLRSGEEQPCVVRDVSTNGARIMLTGAGGLPEAFTIVIEGFAAPTPARLAWQKGREAGVLFGEREA